MTPVRRTDSTSQSCSCTSCLYKSESEQPSIRKYVFHGSRIDRLYYGKYIPSRERKLLNRLVRTRAVYDDLRARLISDSTLSLEKNADLRPGKHRQVINTLDSNKSGAILELVDIIDKGAALDPKKLSECCTCCSCSSKSKILEGTNKEHKHKKGYVRTYEQGYGQREQAGTGEAVYTRTYERKYGKTGQKGTGEGYGGTYERVYGETVPGKTRERHNKRGVWFKAKHIRSDPCTCTFKFSGLINKHSKAMFRKIRPPLEEPYLDVDQHIVEKHKKQNFARKSFQKYKNLRDKLDQDMKKLNESRAHMQQNLQLHAKKSIEQVKHVKNKMKKNIESGVRKSVQAVKALHPKGKEFESVEYPEMETNFKIRKDSIVKFKDYLKRKEIMKDWECDLECEPDICVPEECFKIIKLRRSQKRNRHHDRNRGTKYEVINREMKVGEIPLSKSNSGVQAGHFEMTTATYTKKHKPILRGEGEKQLIEKRLLFESKRMNNNASKKRTKKVANQSERSLEPVKHKESINALRENKRKGHVNEKKVTLKDKDHFVKKDEQQLRGRQAVRISSSFSFDLEFHKNPHGKKVSLSSQPSGIHMHTPRHKDRKVYRRHKKQHVVLNPSIGSSQETQDNTSKTRLIQTDKYGKVRTTSDQELRESNISQCECKKLLSNVKINTEYATKSVSSATNPFVTTDKAVFKEVKQKRRLSQVALLPTRLETQTSEIKEAHPYKQAVRIGSTFSFNVEFYKRDNQNEIKTLPVKENVKQTRSKNIHVRRKLVQIKGRSAKAYSQAKTTLHRCFCTLKLNKRPKKKTKTSKTHSVTCLCELTAPGPSMVDKYVETKKKNRLETSKLYHLLPYECEPGICIPDECDPIICKKNIDLRNQRFRRRISKSTGSYTGPRKTKSTSSIVSSPITSAKAKIVQSSIVPTKTGRTNVPRRYREALYLDRNELIKPKINTSERQAVRIGSSFSFNIEFYKDKHNPVVAVANKPSSSSLPPKIKYEQRKFEDKHVDKRNKSMFTQNINTGKYKGPSLKNCLCTLKLYKNKAAYKKYEKPTKLAANTQTVGETSIGEAVDKGTKTKKERQYKLLSYECEPYICVPGECDPYICLQRIKKRNFNTRNVSAFTDKPDMKSMSSFTENSFKKSEAILVQPKLLRKGIHAQPDYIEVLDGKQKLVGETLKDSKSKQAVRIGSSFKFSIEFTKQLPGTGTLNNLTKIKPVPKDHPKLNRDKGITVTKVRVDHVDTQAIEPTKMNKAAMVRPMLKRCFCTLNLHKKTKQQHSKVLKSQSKYFGPKVYTVGRATTTKTEIISQSFGSQTNAKLQREPKSKIISISTSSFLLNKYIRSVNSKYAAKNIYSAIKTPIQFKEPMIIKSKLSMKIDIVRKLCLYENSKVHYDNSPVKTFNPLRIDENSQNCLKIFNQQSFHNLKNNTGSNKFVEQCFCTMNVQISNQRGTPGINKISKKLKAYECEPGVCIPGECNPYECKKLIARRFAKNVQKASGTETKSISSYTTSHTGLDTKDNQAQAHPRSHSQVVIPEKYKSPRSRKPKQKQAVHIKSSFSFDLEFYKHRSQPFEKKIDMAETSTNIEKHMDPKTYKTVGKRVQIKEFYGKDEKFQPAVMSVHKGTAPMTKRCFCTLKLQKKGKIHRDIRHVNQPTATTLRNARTGTTNKNNKIVIDPNDLRLYECKPGICIPGQCDPYRCLELMRNQKDLGINTFRETNSVSSMTNEEQYKTRAVDAINKKTHHKATRALKHFNDVKDSISYMSRRRSRPAVRIGSSFSFNIEFYKDNPLTQRNEDKINRRVKIENNDTKQTVNKKEVKVDVSPSTKGVFHKATLTEKPLNQDSMAKRSFMERCFCTKNLGSTKVLKNDNKKTFKHKCLCLLGLKSKKNKEYQTVEKNDLQNKENNNFQPAIKPAMEDKRKKIYKPVENRVHTVETNTNYKHKAHLRYLEPYECEPGICIPGQCNPHFCKKIIEQRLRKQYSKKSETESVRTQSVSSSFENHKKRKNERTQAQYQTSKKHVQYVSKPKKFLEEMPSNAVKRLVRIGSNFSFNIEFYKDRENSNVIEDKIKEATNKTNPIENVDHETKVTQHIPKRIETQSVSVRNNKNKVNVKKVQTNKSKKKNVAGTSPLLQRCFCTLKLLNKPIDQVEQIKKEDQLDKKPIITTKSVETQSHKHIKGQSLQNEVLAPYECEPFVCVPGECNPAECLQRIIKRQQQTKDSGTITKHPKRKSIGSVANKKRDENVQVKRLNPIPKNGIQNTNYVFESRPKKNYNQPKQAVRIGSNFSFNIEFFKDITNDLPKKVIDRPIEDLYIENSKEISKKHTKSQPSYLQHNLASQIETTKMQTAETSMAQLRRCFCTLALKDGKPIRHQNTSIKLQTVQPTSDHSSVGDFLRKCMCTLKLNKVGKQQKKPLPPAVKYEVTGTSTTTRRLPQDRFTKRISPLEPYECEPYVCVPGDCNPYECLKRIQKRQVRNFGTDYRRNLKDRATDSIKQPRTKSTKAQYHQKRKINSRGISVAPKRTRCSKEEGQLSSYPYNTNRRVVRIGSNFSFNVEFFKDHITTNFEPKEFNAKKVFNVETLPTKQPVKPPTKSKGSIYSVKRTHHKKSQCSYPKAQGRSHNVNITPKRCFCTLKLLNKPNDPKFKENLPSPSITTKDKMTTTKIKHMIPQELGVYECPPLMCIPGQCNPYDCLEKIKRREVIRKSRNVGTRIARTPIASVGNQALNLKIRKVQSQVMKERNVVASTAHSEPQSEILKSTRAIENANPRNKRAVRIGSNFNFNVEFSKQKSKPAVITVPKIVKTRRIEGDSSYLNKNVTAGAGHFRHYNSYMDNIKLKDQASDTGNLLKRCFCTLQLQKPTRQKRPQAQKLRPDVRYPQAFTVGRVAVEPFFNSPSKKRDKLRSISINTKLLHRTVGTKTNKKYLKNIEFPSLQCNPNNCPDYQKRSFGKKTNNDMQTILPYTPSKYNKKESRTYLSNKNKYNKVQERSVTKQNDILISAAGKRRLTAKKSAKSIPTNSMDTKSNCRNSLFCRCVRFLSRKPDVSTAENLTSTYKPPRQIETVYHPAKIKLIIPPKKAKSFGENCPSICPKDDKEKSNSQNGDVEKNKLKPRTKTKFSDVQSKNGRNFESKHPQMRVTFADTSDYSKKNIPKRKTSNSIHSKSRLCYSCSVNDCPLKFNNLKGKQQISGDSQSFAKSNKKGISYSELADDCQYCECCKRKIDVDEISKGGGDKRSTISSKYDAISNTCPCGKESPNGIYEKRHSLSEASRAAKLYQKYYDKTGKCCSKIAPVFELRLDSVDHDIINKREVTKKITQLSINNGEAKDTKLDHIKSKHRDECVCCKCQIAKREVAEKGASNILSKFRKILPKKNINPTKPVIRISTKPSAKHTNPCICGSKKCIAELQRKRKAQPLKGKSKYGKVCVCGSGICSTESRILKRKKQRIAHKARRKVQSVAEKREREAVLRRVRIQEEKDEIRRRKRIKRNKELEHRVKKYKNASDVMLAIDSLGDVAKLGVSTLTGALRHTTKTFVDPKVACEILCKKCKKKDPETLIKQMQKDYMESDAASTMRRLKMRCLFMKKVQSLKQKLEANPVTHFILHLADKNPKTRVFKRKPVRRIREPLDFQCSLYMATLRKRPYLSVYYKWPWFYPHFITMLNIWRQFTDIMLFLLAAVVWSPCILCMEGCRALMCCFFCTG